MVQVDWSISTAVNDTTLLFLALILLGGGMVRLMVVTKLHLFLHGLLG